MEDWQKPDYPTANELREPSHIGTEQEFDGGEYTVTIEWSGGRWAFKGYAENISDALYKSLEQRQEETAR